MAAEWLVKTNITNYIIGNNRVSRLLYGVFFSKLWLEKLMINNCVNKIVLVD